jgi:hypothetical protein
MDYRVQLIVDSYPVADWKKICEPKEKKHYDKHLCIIYKAAFKLLAAAFDVKDCVEDGHEL